MGTRILLVPSQNADIPVYEGKPKSSKVRRIRTLHRELLLPFSAIPGGENSQTKDWGIQSKDRVGQVADDPDKNSAGLGNLLPVKLRLETELEMWEIISESTNQLRSMSILSEEKWEQLELK